MAEQSSIEWTRSTFNPWWGCTKVSPGCDNCYAERDAHRFGTQWGPDAERRFFGDKHWDEPLKWNKKAAEEQAIDPNAQWRVFCASMADVFDNDVPQAVRERLWDLIDATPNLTWLLLTKRIGNVGRMIPDRWSVSLPRNVWLGISVVNQDEADRDILKLLEIKAYVHWLSIEPLLGPIRVDRLRECEGGQHRNALTGEAKGFYTDYTGLRKIAWCVVGGESGPNARPMHHDWARSLRDQCKAAGVPFLFKQWGEFAPNRTTGKITNLSTGEIQRMRDGGDMIRVGKKAAGRLLDGVLHDEYPVVKS